MDFGWDMDDEPIIPSEYTIGALGLPADENAPKHWGKTFTVYVEPNAGLYHRGRCQYVTKDNTYPSHILLAKNKYLPCELCKPEIPDMSWYFKALENEENNTFLRDLSD